MSLPLSYSALRFVHVSAVTVSFTGFVGRGIGALSGATWVRHRFIRVAPHIIDTILLLSALGMLWVIRLDPWAAPWLRAKLIGLVIYIILGVRALRLGVGAATSRAVRAGAWVAALLTFGFIVSVAITKNPWGLLALMR